MNKEVQDEHGGKEMSCNCKMCSDSKRIQTTKEIGENYNYSCYEHSTRSALKWILLSHASQRVEKIISMFRAGEDIEAYSMLRNLYTELNDRKPMMRACPADSKGKNRDRNPVGKTNNDD